MRKIVWTDDAVGSLEAIATYISAFDPAASARLAARLIEVADSLAEYSERGRDAGGGMREMTTVWPYILRYRVSGDTVIILRIRHGAQQDDPQGAA
ncbi:MAG TPA: type II toxin-antitoxin system RelE/ParE family toxin [Allosphingosinicella sp.]